MPTFDLNHVRTVELEITSHNKGSAADSVSMTYLDVSVRDRARGRVDHVGSIKAETLINVIRQLEAGTLHMK